MFDLIFDKPNDGDDVFRTALDCYRDKVVIGANVDYSGVQEIGDNGVIVPPNASLVSPPQLEDDRVGYVLFFPDPLDQKVRAARYTLTIVTLLAISAAYLGLAWVLYDRWGILINIVPTLTAFLLSGVFGLAFEYTLERYVSKNLVKEILENPTGYYSSARGARKPGEAWNAVEIFKKK